MATIIVKEITNSALSEKSGLLLRNAIEDILKRLDDNDNIVLDFSDIRLFGSSFFNSSIGFLIKKYGEAFVIQKIKFDNLSDLGKKTYDRSYDNAIKQSQDELENTIGQITRKNIEES